MNEVIIIGWALLLICIFQLGKSIGKAEVYEELLKDAKKRLREKQQ